MVWCVFGVLFALLMKVPMLQPPSGLKLKLPMLSLVSSLFLLIVVMPTALGVLFDEVIASDRYVVEAKFIVRGVSGRQAGGLEAIFRTFGISRAEDDAFAVHNFIQSRDAVRALDNEISLKGIFGKKSADIFSRFPRLLGSKSFEALYEYYLERVEVLYQASTGISTLRASAFYPEDAKVIVDKLLLLSEKLINRMNDRANSDTLQYAESELAQAEKQVILSQREITDYRNSELVLDPSITSLKTLDFIGSMAEELSRTRLQLDELIRKSPSNPSIQSLKVQIEAIEGQIAAEKSKIVGGSEALSSKIATFERLALNREFADRNLAAAFVALETARQEGGRQHLYIETVVAPVLPDEPIEPRRMRNILTILLAGCSSFGMIWLVIAGSREHMRG